MAAREKEVCENGSESLIIQPILQINPHITAKW